jgi:hypothetical protein
MLARIKTVSATAITIVVFAVVGAVVLFVAYEWNMAGYDTYRRYRPSGGIGRVEWFLGVRPADNEWKSC